MNCRFIAPIPSTLSGHGGNHRQAQGEAVEIGLREVVDVESQVAQDDSSRFSRCRMSSVTNCRAPERTLLHGGLVLSAPRVGELLCIDGDFVALREIGDRSGDS